MTRLPTVRALRVTFCWGFGSWLDTRLDARLDTRLDARLDAWLGSWLGSGSRSAWAAACACIVAKRVAPAALVSPFVRTPLPSSPDGFLLACGGECAVSQSTVRSGWVDNTCVHIPVCTHCLTSRYVHHGLVTKVVKNFAHMPTRYTSQERAPACAFPSTILFADNTSVVPTLHFPAVSLREQCKSLPCGDAVLKVCFDITISWLRGIETTVHQAPHRCESGHLAADALNNTDHIETPRGKKECVERLAGIGTQVPVQGTKGVSHVPKGVLPNLLQVIHKGLSRLLEGIQEFSRLLQFGKKTQLRSSLSPTTGGLDTLSQVLQAVSLQGIWKFLLDDTLQAFFPVAHNSETEKKRRRKNALQASEVVCPGCHTLIPTFDGESKREEVSRRIDEQSAV